ncbi:MAG: nitroreductase family protein [Deltaproteobacteria bacterium]|nr:nitroreductase family protein [Deltaproteobacteria bacterium]
MNGPETLDWLRQRRSVRRFKDAPIPRPALRRLIEAAITAPSGTNRQPWRFAVVLDPQRKLELRSAVRFSAEKLTRVIGASPHRDEFGHYGDFFFEPLETAAVIVIPQYREYPDQLSSFVASAGASLSALDGVESPAAMHSEICATSAAVMALLLQATAEGLGACWMAGPMIARASVERVVGVKAPFHMLGAVAVGWPDERPAPVGRRDLDRVVTWFEPDDAKPSE